MVCLHFENQGSDMLDRNFVRENLDYVRERLAARGGRYPLDELVAVETEWKQVGLKAEDLRRQRNESSELVGKAKREGQDTRARQAEIKEIGNQIKALEESRRVLEEKLNSFLHTIPNLPHPSVPTGSDETANAEVRRWGKPPQFDFEPLDHVDLGTALGILDMERAAKIAGARFALLVGAGSLLERALINFMLDVHTKYHGYTEVLPPFMVNSSQPLRHGQPAQVRGQDLFKIEGDRLLPHPHRRGAGDKHLPRRDPGRSDAAA